MKVFFSLIVCCFLVNSANAQFKVSGKVSDKDLPLPGSTVQLLNTKYITVTDAEGNFEFILPNGSYTLKVTHVGYKVEIKNFSILDKEEILNIGMTQDMIQLKSIEILSVRANVNSAVAVSNLDSNAIAQNNLGADMPYLLDQTPSVVVTSDAGNGVGYTGIRIRGSDPTRVNVTINGIPVNDAESQGVYWVDFPDLASSTNSIQIQRGAGTSTNGAGAFGGTVNIQTQNENENAFAVMSNSYGSFNTHKHTFNAGTGKIGLNKNGNSAASSNDYFTFNTRLSWIGSDGYIDRATSDMKSYYLSAAYVAKKSDLRFVMFSGKEKTYQAWYGVPKDSLETNRTYNPYTYQNETDNYIQTNYQLLYNFNCNRKLSGNISFHYTKGAGYYEQFRAGDYFSSYGLDDIIIGTDTISTTDLIRRRWLDNDFYGTVYSLNYSPDRKLNILFGGGYNQYIGSHFGEIIWAQFAANMNYGDKYYDDDATKKDMNNFVKLNYWLTSKINFLSDLQIRKVNYEFTGFDASLNNVTQNADLFFFNPKFGLTGYLNRNQIVYSSFAIANKEPNRDDYTSSSPTSRPRAENMMDLELGYKISALKFSANVNLYHMQYKDQLVLTGKINDVGAYTRQNIKDSYRQGIELEAGWKMNDFFNVNFNATVSRNKINNYVEYIDNWDTWGQDSVVYTETDIAFSPNVIAGANFNFHIKWNSRRKTTLFYIYPKANFIHELNVSILPKYVGKQFIDNTSSDERMLEAYLVTDARLTWTRKRESSGRFIALNFMVRNLLNEMYSSNAWSYRYTYGGSAYTDFGFFPQAGVNYMIGLSIGF